MHVCTHVHTPSRRQPCLPLRGLHRGSRHQDLFLLQGTAVFHPLGHKVQGQEAPGAPAHSACREDLVSKYLPLKTSPPIAVGGLDSVFQRHHKKLPPKSVLVEKQVSIGTYNCFLSAYQGAGTLAGIGDSIADSDYCFCPKRAHSL